MTTPTFDASGIDRTSFAPFILEDARNTESEDVRLEFSDWDWLRTHCGGDNIDGYYLNGPGVEGLVKATRQLNGLDPDPDTMDPNSEGDTCYIHFSSLEEAVETAEISAKMIRDLALLRQAAATAEKEGFGD